MLLMSTRILIVEDEAAVALDVARGLERQGYEIAEIVETADAALGAARTRRPDLVLMDVRLGHSADGIEAAREIGTGLGIPLVLLASQLDENAPVWPEQSRALGCVSQPFDEAELRTTIELALRQQEQRGVRSTPAAAEPGRESDDRFQLLVRSLPDHAVFLLDEGGRIQSGNPAAETLYGHRIETLLGRPFSFLHAPEELAAGTPERLLAEAATTGSHHAEHRHQRNDGGEFWADVLITALRDPAAALLGFAAVVRNVSERRKAEDTLRQLNATLEQHLAERTRELSLLNKELEAFTYSVAHDLRAPLRGVSGYLEAIREDHAAELPAPALAFLERGLSCAHRMQSLVDDLLRLSRISRQELHRVPTALKPLVADVIAGLAAETRGREITWNVGELPVVPCDPGLVRQVFSNLLSNAVKYTRPCAGAVVEVRREIFDAETVILVRDNGVGFDMRHAGSLFTPFFRMHNAQEFEGTGIGLAMTERIIRRHGGRIWAEAEVGKGATFYFTLSAPVATATSG